MIYLDHHATTPLDPRVLAAMLPYLREHFGNPGSPHAFGRVAEAAVERARAQIAGLVGAQPSEIVFTSGATESNNLALRGVAAFYRDLGDHLVTTAIEHKAVLETTDDLEAGGLRVTRVPVDDQGVVDPEAIADVIEPGTLLVSVMLANNEIGTVQPLAEIGRITRARGVLLHTDAVQGLGKVPFDVEAMGVDLASISAHKMHGPKGIGALYVRQQRPRVRLVPELTGGGQEGGRRPGTLNVPGVVGLGAAAELARQERAAEALRVGALRDRLLGALGSRVHVNGSLPHRLPGNLSVCFPGSDGRALVEALDARGVACSTGSACSRGVEPSHVLLALGHTADEARSAVRFGLGRWTTAAEVDQAARIVLEVLR
jgi:cysteine desulfurase